ncbi:MAG: glycosyltransferase family 4 protein [Candidatus Portnoybacteria bacterium]|nr:glycosyltransferase family 4 protein [Candidatus Portnoybacteria bacterium]
MEEKRRILIFSTAYLPLIGGAEIAVHEITRRLDDFEFDLICARIKPELPCNEKQGNMTIWRLGCGSLRDKFFFPWRAARLAGKLHSQKRFEAVWAIMASFGGLAALFFKKKFRKTPYILTLQEGDSNLHIFSRAVWLGPFWRQIFSKADRLTAISHYLKRFAKKHGARSEIEIVPNGVDLRKFRISNGENQTRSKLGIGKDEKIIITVSRLVKKNGLGDVIGALALLPENYKFLVLGSGPLEKNLKFKAKKLELENRVLFLGDVANKEIPTYLAIADVFIRPSLSEGLGNSFLEAMAAGVPIIGTPVGGIPDFLKDRETGIFCEVKNPKSVAEKIKLLLENGDLKKKLIENGKRIVEERYNWDSIALKMKEIFNKTI